MKSLIENIQKHLLVWIGGALVVGLGVGKLTGGIPFSPVICLLAALIMIYPSLVPLSFKQLKESHGNAGLILLSVALNFIVAPGIAFLLGYIFLKNEPALRLGLLLLALLPGGGMATTWAMRSKSDMPAVVGMIFVNLVVAIFIVPLTVSYATGSFFAGVVGAVPIVISPFKLLMPVVVIIIFPLLLAFFTQMIIRKRVGEDGFDKVKKDFSGFSNLGLVIIITVLMALKGSSLVFTAPGTVLRALLPLALFYVIQLGIVLMLYRGIRPEPKARSMVWGGYLRYITLALGLASSLLVQNQSLSPIIIMVVLSYFIQIPASYLLARFFASKTGQHQ